MRGCVLTLVRHGEIVGAETRRYIGQSDVPLSPRGIARALSLREALRTTHFDAVYCSSLVRSRQTAEIIAGRNGAGIRVHDELQEISLGAWEGRSREEIATLFADQFAARGEDIAGYRIPGGESFTECRTRVLAAFTEIVGLQQWKRADSRSCRCQPPAALPCPRHSHAAHVQDRPELWVHERPSGARGGVSRKSDELRSGRCCGSRAGVGDGVTRTGKHNADRVIRQQRDHTGTTANPGGDGTVFLREVRQPVGDLSPGRGGKRGSRARPASGGPAAGVRL